MALELGSINDKDVTSSGASGTLPSGTQALDRGIGIMRVLAKAGPSGLRLIDVQGEMGLTHSTTHRLLAALIRNQIVEQEGADRRYRLARQWLTSGWSMLALEGDLRDLCAHDLEALAEDTGDAVHLVVRSGYESVCLSRCVGSYPIKVLTVDAGTRRPLGVGASGIALLSGFPESEAEEVLRVVEHLLEGFPPLTVADITQRVSAARRDGFALSEGYQDRRVRGLAIPLRRELGGLVGALSVVATPDRMTDERIPEVVAMLKHRRDSIESIIESARFEER